VPRVDKQESTARKSSAKRTLQESGFSESAPVPDSRAEKKQDPSPGVRDSDMTDGSDEEDSDDEESDEEDESPAISDSDDSDTEWDEEKLMKANERKYWNR